jgi:hypothetical protein
MVAFAARNSESTLDRHPDNIRKSYGLSNPLSKPRILPRAYATPGGLMSVTRPYRRACALEWRAENH